MLIREYNKGDLDALGSIHSAQGFGYALPDLRNPLFVTKLVLLDAEDVNVAPRGIYPDSVRSPASSGADLLSSSPVGAQRTPPLQQGPKDAETPAVREALAARNPSTWAGRIVGAALLRLTAEAYLLLDPRGGTPRERWQWLLALHEAVRHDAWQRGLEDVHAWLPPPIAQKFGRRLERLGWRRDDSWTPYCVRLEGK